MTQAAEPRGLLPRTRWTFANDGLIADVTTRAIGVVAASRHREALTLVTSDADAIDLLVDLAAGAIAAVHSIARDGETLDQPTAADLIASFTLGDLSAFCDKVVRGPQTDFAHPG